MKVAIIGSGIAGLSLALMCNKLGLKVQLYEKTQQLRNIGSGILVWPFGIKYLEYFGLANQIKSYLEPLEAFNVYGYNGEGSVLCQKNYQELNRIIAGNISCIERSTFQQALLDQLPSGILQLGKPCITLTQEMSTLKMIFADGSSDIADIVIGADGVHSVVRKLSMPSISSAYSNYYWWGGIIGKDKFRELLSRQSHVILGSRRTCLIMPIHNQRYLWYFLLKIDEHEVGEISLLSGLQQRCSDWSNDLVQVVLDNPQSYQFSCPVRVLSDIVESSIPNTCLIGDAMHAMSPILGLGSSIAIEDAFVLAHLLKNNNDLNSTIATYQSLRCDRVKKMMLLEQQSINTMITDDLVGLDKLQQQILMSGPEVLYKDLLDLISEQEIQEIINSREGC